MVMQTFDIIPQGVCCRRMHVTVDEGRVVSASFEGGCHGNLQGIGSLIAGMPVEEVVKRLKGIQCGMKATSCPDQLARALEAKELV